MYSCFVGKGLMPKNPSQYNMLESRPEFCLEKPVAVNILKSDQNTKGKSLAIETHADQIYIWQSLIYI